MKIAMLTTAHQALDVRIFYKEVISLSQSGHAITLFAQDDPQVREVTDAHNIVFVPLSGSGGRVRRCRQLLGLLRKHGRRFDAWHFHDPELLPLMWPWRLLVSRGTRLVYDAHEDLPKSLAARRWVPGPFKRLMNACVTLGEHALVSGMDAVIAATEPIRARLAQTCALAIVAHNYPRLAVETELGRRAHSATRTGELRLIYSGAMVPERGVPQMLEAMRQLGGKPISMELLGWWPSPEFERDMRSLATDRISFRAHVPFSEVRAHMDAADVGLVCSQPTKAYVEALPLKMFEYMQAGLPVIVPDFPVLREIVELAGCGIAVDSTDPAAIVGAIQLLAADPDLRSRMGNAGQRAIKERYSWEREAVGLAATYRQLELKTNVTDRAHSHASVQ
jgi:glycosyltransferase involved in cell wall biosynthesis